MEMWERQRGHFVTKNIFMRKLTKEEAEKLVPKKGSSSVVRTAVMHLGVGEILLIDKSDWTQKTGPGQMLTRLSKSSGMVFNLNALADGSGWVVERVR